MLVKIKRAALVNDGCSTCLVHTQQDATSSSYICSKLFQCKWNKTFERITQSL